MRIGVYLPGDGEHDFECSGTWEPKARCPDVADLDEVAGVIRLDAPATLFGEEFAPGTPVLITRRALVVDEETRRVLWRLRRVVLPGQWALLVKPVSVGVN